MAKVTLINIPQVVSEVIDDIVTSNVNVVAAQEAVVDAEEAKDLAVSAATAADSSKSLAEAARDSAISSATEAEGYAEDALTSKQAVESSLAYVDGVKVDVDDLANEVEGYRDDALNYLAAMNVKYDEFDDRYLGAHATDPSTDNDGHGIQEGALYWNMVDKAMQVWTGSVWNDVAAASGALLVASNLADLDNKATARTNLDVYSKSETNTEVRNTIAALVDSSPSTLDTLNELAAALGDDPNFATTTATAISERVVKNANIVAGTHTKVTYDAKGLVTAGETPTTLAGYSIADAYDMTTVDSTINGLIMSIANLASANAQGQFGSSATTAIGTSLVQLPFSVITQSTNQDKFVINADNTITILEEGDYTFLSTVTFESSTDYPRNMTFRVTNNSGGAVLYEEVAKVEIASGDKNTIPFNSLMKVDAAAVPVTVRINALASGTGYNVVGLNSVLSVQHSGSVLTSVAEGISFTNGNGLVSTNVQDAIEELQANVTKDLEW